MYYSQAYLLFFLQLHCSSPLTLIQGFYPKVYKCLYYLLLFVVVPSFLPQPLFVCPRLALGHSLRLS